MGQHVTRTPGQSAGSTLFVERRRMIMADLGPENPFPMLAAPESPYATTSAIPAEIRRKVGYGYPRSLYPYQQQDGYGRHLSARALNVVVLENERLRAVFLPELGGRLWELFDKTVSKQLLHSPPSIQFANLALRNAWFAGGVEWNIGTRGHSPTTCSPLHAGIVTAGNGLQILRMWEFERLREVVFQVDAWLPADSPVLLISVRIQNPNAETVPMYWWSNAAVPQTDGTRVIAPARFAFASSYTDGIDRVDPTHDGGMDRTWPRNNPRARDFFFGLPARQRKWILAADQDGDGLAMLSTSKLLGRKLFVWGQGTGGGRWQEWLSPDGGRYAEIQAGLASTQFEHVPMPGGTEWGWTEAYGNARVDPGHAHGNWPDAVEHCEQRVDALLSLRSLGASHAEAQLSFDRPPEQMITTGTGWGALEAIRRHRHGSSWLSGSGTPFVLASITEDQQPWLDLLAGAAFSGSRTFVAGRDWQRLLERAPENAQTLLHRGVLRHACGDLNQARSLYGASLARDPSAAAHRGLAIAALQANDTEDAIDSYLTACSLDPTSRPLLIEAVTTFINFNAAQRALDLLHGAATLFPDDGRLRCLSAMALARTGRSEEAAELLRRGLEVPDLREGENSLSTLWTQVCPDEEVPREYQFSMG
jgi:tetratricopeptide (TPR) repeat protein